MLKRDFLVNGVAVGTYYLSPMGTDCTELVSIEVKKEHRRRGHGGNIVKEITSWADTNKTHLLLNVLATPGGAPAEVIRDLYGKNGFTSTGKTYMVRPPRAAEGRG